MEGVKAWAKEKSGGPITTGLESPQTKMAFAFNLLGMSVYAGTADTAKVARNRKKNKAARKARTMHRKASK